MKFYFEKDNTAIAMADGKMETLANFLQSDIQQDAELANIILRNINKDKNYQMTGNSHELERHGDEIEIRNQLDDKASLYTLSQVQESLEDWLRFITT